VNLVRGSIVFTAAQLVLLVVGLISSIVISRSLGPDGRGVVALVTVVMTTATALATFGLGSAYAYLAGKRAHAYDQLVGSIVVMAAALGVVTSAILLVFSDALLDSILRGMSTLQFGVTVASIPFVYLTFFLVNFLLGAGRAEEAAWMQLAAGIFTSAAIILALVVADQDVTGVIVVTVVATAVVAGAYLVVVARRYGLSLGGMRVVGAAPIRAP
jgi:O-antigen/teichoic acid export membrane protein